MDELGVHLFSISDLLHQSKMDVEILLCAGFQLKVGNYLSCGE